MRFGRILNYLVGLLNFFLDNDRNVGNVVVIVKRVIV